MQIIKALFYILYIINGGFRQFGFEYSFYSKLYLNNYNTSVHSFVLLGEKTVFILAILALVFNRIRGLDLSIFLVLFILDIYFQNFVKFESSIILVHFTPLLFFLSTVIKNNKKTAYVALLFLSVGFSTSALLKIFSGWLNWENLVLYSYVVEFNKGYKLPSLFGDYFIRMNFPFYFWKMCDYATVLFQSSFLLLFFDLKWYRLLLPLSVLFHLIILLFLGISVFFPFILVYLYIIILLREENLFKRKFDKRYSYFITLIGLLLLGYIIYFDFDINFFYRHNSEIVYLYLDYILNILLGISVLGICFYQPLVKNRIQ